MPSEANPPPWRVLRSAAYPILRPRLHAPRVGLVVWWSWLRAASGWLLTRPGASWRRAWVVVLEVGGAVLVPVGVVAFVLDLQNREEDRINRAWSLIAAAKVEGTGNVGLIEAMQTLVSRGINLASVKLPGAYLNEARLSGAKLDGADLHDAQMYAADLRNADLSNATLIGTKLSHADLQGALLFFTKLNEADLNSANLTGAVVFGVDLRGVDLVGADLRGAVVLGVDLRGVDLIKDDLRGALICTRNMPDGSACKRDCGAQVILNFLARVRADDDDRSCPFLDRQEPEG